MAETWQDDMATGVSEIDEDHRRIAALFDRLCRSVSIDSHRETIITILGELVEAMCEHIAREEELMSRCRFDDGGRHHRDHDEFINRLSALVVDYQTGDERMAGDTIALVRSWKFHHLIRYDAPLARAILAARESAVTAAR